MPSVSVCPRSSPTPITTPRLSRRPGLRQRLRLLRVRVRQRGRVELRGWPLLGPGVRFDVAPAARVIVGDGVSLGARCRVHVCAGTVTIGDGAELGDRCAVIARQEVVIGQRCVLGDEVAITDFDQRSDDVDTPIRLQEPIASPVRIEAGAVLGPRAAILRGVRIGAGARVGAHSVVARDVPAGAVVEGTPARPPARPPSRPQGPSAQPGRPRRGARGPDS
jgi:acetyltransferase-like isoleucine patch superfamily enzyme